MFDWVPVSKALAENVALLLSLALTHSRLSQKLDSLRPINQKLIFSLFFSIIAIFAMIFSIEIYKGVFIDARLLILGAAGAYYGPIVAITTACLSAIYRFEIGGPGTLAGILAMFGAAAIGCVFHSRQKQQFHYGLSILALLGFLLFLNGFAFTWILPGDYRTLSISPYSIFLILSYPAGAILLGVLIDDANLRREEESRRASELALKQSESLFRTMADASPVPIAILRPDKFMYVNPAWQEASGYTQQEILNVDPMSFVHPKMRDTVREYGKARLQGSKAPTRYEVQVHTKSGNNLWMEIAATTIPYEGDQAVLAVCADITERQELIKKLQNAVDELNILRGILPVCSYCKKVRSDAGDWEHIEEYVANHTAASISHGICPECVKEYHPETL